MSSTPPLSGTERQPAVDEQVAELVARARDHVRDLDEAIVAAIGREVPAYAAMGAAGDDVVRRGLSAVPGGGLLEVVLGAKRLEPSEAAAIERLGGQPHATAIAYHDMMDAYGVAVRTIWAFLVNEAATLPPSPAVPRALGEILLRSFASTHDVGQLLTRGFVAHQSDVAAQRVTAERDLAERLLLGTFHDDDDAEEQAVTLGRTSLRVPHGLVVFVDPSDPPSPSALRRAKAELLDAVAGAIDGSLLTVPVVHGVAIVPIEAKSQWARVVGAAREAAQREGSVALLVDPAAGARRIHTAYRRATELIALAAQVCDPGAVALDDLDVFALVASSPDDAAALVTEVLGPVLELPASRRDPLIEVLDALWACSGRVADVARTLHLSEQAVRHRLRRIETLTGLRLADPADRLRLDLARHALRLRGEGRAWLGSDRPAVHRPG